MRTGDSRDGTAVAVLDEDTFPAGAGVSVATFAGLDDDGRFLVSIDSTAVPAAALSTIALTAADAGARVAIAHERGDAGRPIIIGRIHQRAETPLSGLTVEDERVVIRAERDIELRCGDASIVLTRSGKVLIHGNFVLTRSRGANKIKGAFVDIN